MFVPRRCSGRTVYFLVCGLDMAAQIHGRQSHRTSTNSIDQQVLPEKLTSPQLVKKFSAFYRTRRFITAFTRARHLPLSWARSIQYIPPSHTSKIHFNISFPFTPGSSKWLLPSAFPAKTLYAPRSASAYVLHALSISVILMTFGTSLYFLHLCELSQTILKRWHSGSSGRQGKKEEQMASIM